MSAAALARRVSGRRGGAVHLVVKGELLASADAAQSKEGNPGQPLVQSVDPHRVDHQVGVTLGGGRGGGDMYSQ